MTAAASFPKLAALADAKFSYRDELGRQCREALSTIDRLTAERDRLRRALAWWDSGKDRRPADRDRDALADLLVREFQPDRPYPALDEVIRRIMAGVDAEDAALFHVIPEDNWGIGFEDRPDIDMVAFIERGEGQA